VTDPVLLFIAIAAFFFLLTIAAWFKTLDGALWREAGVPLIAGVIAGVIVHYLDHAATIGIVLTLAALYVRLTGSESEPADGMALGAMTGGAASFPLALLDTDTALLRFASCVLAGAVAGYGITFGLTHVRDKTRQLLIDAATAAVAIGVAALPKLLLRTGMAERHIALAAAGLVPLLIIATVFKQAPDVRTELRHEASLGVIDDDDVRPTAHPLLRLGRGGWHDAAAHREFVRIANKIALRKRQQRGRSEEMARLYQLEVIKLRMELQEMTRIDRAMRAHDESVTSS
jgi:hypothetical protein